jgi:hypothetical protein
MNTPIKQPAWRVPRKSPDMIYQPLSVRNQERNSILSFTVS